MSSVIPGPFSRAASAIASGLVSLGAQTFAGVKTFANAVVMSAGLTITGLMSSTSVRTGIGSAADVAYGATDDPDTGVWFPALNTINIVTAGTLRVQFTAGGVAAFQGGLTMPTNTIFQIGAFQSYESPGGTLNLGGSADIVALGAILQLNALGHARPAASSANRGKLWYSKSAGGAADTIQICLKSAADSYSWVTIGTG